MGSRYINFRIYPNPSEARTIRNSCQDLGWSILFLNALYVHFKECFMDNSLKNLAQELETFVLKGYQKRVHREHKAERKR